MSTKFHRILKNLIVISSFSTPLIQPVFSASFDCTKASTPTEKTICTNKKLSIMDGIMGVYFRSELTSGKDQNAVKADQRKWNKTQRDSCGTDVSCLENAYQTRLEGTLDQSLLNGFFLANDWKKGKYLSGNRFCTYEYTKGIEKLTLEVYCAGDAFNNITYKCE